MRSVPGAGVVVRIKDKQLAKAVTGLSLLFISGVLLLGCKPENQTGSQSKTSSVEVNRRTKTAKLPAHSESQLKGDRKLGVLSSSTLHQLKPSAILNNKSSGEAYPVETETGRNDADDILVPAATALVKFYNALYEIESGSRTHPVTILHLGSDQIAMDRFSGDLRKMFQERFGNAGRGMMAPGLSFPLYRADGTRISQTGDWVSLNLVNGDTGFFGLAGVLKQAISENATLTMESTGLPFTWAEVSFIASPDQGSVRVSITGEDKVARTVSLKSATPQIKRIRLVAKGRQLQVQSLTRKPVTISSWSIGEERAGIRYVSLGLPGATADHAHLWDASVIENELITLKPDLIILDYGVAESQNDILDIPGYGRRFAKFHGVLTEYSRNSSFIIIGVRDISRLPITVRSDSPLASGWPCRDLSNEERENYNRLIKKRHVRLNRWHPPPNLKLVRQVQLDIASIHGSYFWDWSRQMGGVCGVHAWVHSTPPLASKNHLRLTDQGIRKSARALFTDIVSGYTEYRQIAQR